MWFYEKATVISKLSVTILKAFQRAPNKSYETMY